MLLEFLRILNIFDTHTRKEEKVFKETYSGVYLKGFIRIILA